MKITFISGLCIIALLCAGCAATGSDKKDSGADAGKAPQAAGESVSKTAKKPRPKPVKPPQPLDESLTKSDAKPQATQQWLPTVFVPAFYPQKALDKGIEGHVTLEFTVTRTGSLQDVVVIDSSPPGYFEEAALKAATQFRYEPRIINGEPVDVPRAQYKMIFKLEYLRPKS